MKGRPGRRSRDAAGTAGPASGSAAGSTWTFAPDRLLAALAGLLALLVHRRVLGAYFVPDDFVQLARAHGLAPWPVSAWRWLSGYALARVTTGAFGTEPWPYHALNLALLGLAAALLYLLARRWGASRAAAFAGAACFGVSRVHFTALVAASWTGEFLSLALLLGALLASGPGPRRLAWSVLLVVGALASKENVLALPLVALLVPASAPGAAPARRAALTLAAAALAAGAVFIADGWLTGRFGGEAYATAFGVNLAHSLFTLLRWAVDPLTPVPDLATHPDPGAWVVGLPVLAALVAAGVALRRRAPCAAAGAAWCLLGLLPVLPLLHQTYLHYLVTPWAGIALVLAGALDAWIFPALSGGARAPGRAGGRRVLAAAGALVLVWALAQDRLLAVRWTARLPASETPLDPVLRKSEYARRLIGGTARALAGRPAHVAFFVLDGTQQDFDVRTGVTRQSREEEDAGRTSTVVSTLGDGSSLRIFAPGVDTVVFVRRLEGSLRGFDCFLPTAELYVQHLGRPPEALEQLGGGLVHFGLNEPAVRLLEVATREWPNRPRMMWAYAVALAAVDRDVAAREVLREIVRTAPADSFATLARTALAAEPTGGR